MPHFHPCGLYHFKDVLIRHSREGQPEYRIHSAPGAMGNPEGVSYGFTVLERKRPLCEKAALSFASRSPPGARANFLYLLDFGVLFFALFIGQGARCAKLL